MVQPSGVREVTLQKDDVDLMWKLFDYAAVSRQSQTTSQTPKGDQGPEDAVRMTSDHHQRSETAANSLEVNADAACGIQNPSLTWENLPEVNHVQPEDDEWLLFGNSWSAYFPGYAEPWQNFD